jgi:uncharacterized protein (DUF433 family)
MTATMIGQGLYDAAEIARLVGHDTDWVVRWATPSGKRQAIVKPTFDPYFSFADLVGFRVGHLVRRKGVSDADLRTAVRTLRELTGLRNPLAAEHVIKSLATSGRSFLSDLKGEYEDIGKGRQGVFQDIVKLHLSRVSFDSTGDPTRWEPADGVSIDPTIQAGAPCISGTRIPTATIADLIYDANPEDLALDFDVSVEAILLADKFEATLAEGAGVPA